MEILPLNYALNSGKPLFLALMFGHLLFDFYLQPSAWVKDKFAKNYLSPYLYLHAALHALPALVFTGDVLLALFIAVTHLVIDSIKIAVKQDTAKAFIFDQAAHIAVLIGALYWFKPDVLIQLPTNYIISTIVAFMWVLTPASLFIQRCFPNRNNQTGTDGIGRAIGYCERSLILCCIMAHQYEAIGWLLASKSILRFRLNDKTAHSEYVLLGTLISLMIVVSIGSAWRLAQ